MFISSLVFYYLAHCYVPKVLAVDLLHILIFFDLNISFYIYAHLSLYREMIQFLSELLLVSTIDSIL